MDSSTADDENATDVPEMSEAMYNQIMQDALANFWKSQSKEMEVLDIGTGFKLKFKKLLFISPVIDIKIL